MKRKLAFILSIVFIFCFATNFSVSAAQQADSAETDIVYFEDGSYLVTTLETDSGISLFSSTQTGIKTATYYNSDNVAACALRVTATFSYDGTTVSCTSVQDVSYTYVSGWKVENVTTSKSAASTTKASATAKGNAVQRVLGVAVVSKPISVTVYCDKNGNIS